MPTNIELSSLELYRVQPRFILININNQTSFNVLLDVCLKKRGRRQNWTLTKGVKLGLIVFWGFIILFIAYIVAVNLPISSCQKAVRDVSL